MSLPVATRTINDPDQTEWLVYEQQPAQNGVVPKPLNYTGTVPIVGIRRLFEAITPNSTKGWRKHKKWKAFEHYKAQSLGQSRVGRGVITTCDFGQNIWLRPRGILQHVAPTYRATDFGPYGLFNTGQTAWYVPRSDGGFIPAPTDLEDLKKRGLKAMLPKIKADMNAVVSSIELKDILSIKGTIKNTLKVSKYLFSRIGGLGTRTLAHALGSQGSDVYLQWMFNIKPLLSDIGGIYHAVATHQKRINALVSRSGKLQTAHYKCVLREQGSTKVESTADNYLPLFLWNGNTWVYFYRLCERRQVTTSAVFSCCMQYNYNYTDYQIQNQKILGLLDMLGVNLNPNTIWQLIPFSFVVDWVVDIGQWLDQFKIENMKPKVNIMQYCWSIRKERYTSVTNRLGSVVTYNRGGLNRSYISYPVVHETSYRRGIDRPSTSSFTTSGLSPTELSLGAALILTRRRFKPRKLRK